MKMKLNFVKLHKIYQKRQSILTSIIRHEMEVSMTVALLVTVSPHNVHLKKQNKT